MNCFPDEIDVRMSDYKEGVRWFKLHHFFRCITSKGLFIVPTGFQTDIASIPRAFHTILSPLGEYAPAAIFHDWAYSRQSNGYFPADRKAADDIFLELMHNLGIPWYSRHSIHLAVRMFGGKSYKKR
jgi:hypothetical protein